MVDDQYIDKRLSTTSGPIVNPGHFVGITGTRIELGRKDLTMCQTATGIVFSEEFGFQLKVFGSDFPPERILANPETGDVLVNLAINAISLIEGRLGSMSDNAF